MMSHFHLLRPEWLMTLLPLLLFSWLLLRKQLFSRSWKSVIDPKLLPHLLIGKPGKSSRLPILIFFISGVIVIFSLSGPVWEKLPQPVFKEQSALIIALDLSKSMDATDIKPSRLTRARHKISDILKLRKEGQTALIVYAAEAFTVSPLTDDVATIESLLSSLETNLMPAQGSRTDIALVKAAELLKNAAISNGDIIIITDGINSTLNNLHANGHRISILGVGTAEGGPITLSNGGFLKDSNGSIVISRLDSSSLRSIATKTGGRFSLMTTDDTDIKYLLDLLDINRINAEAIETQMKSDIWREQGPWLLLLIIPFAAFAFRRGYLVLLLALIMPYPQPATALSWDELWTNDNQRAAKKLQQNNASDAARLFKHHQWKATAHFKAEQYEQALEQYEKIDTVDSHYNRGNTLAKMGRMDEALDAYNKTLEKQADHEDALYNKKQLEQQKQDQQQKKGDDSKDQQPSDDKASQDSSDQNQSSKDSQNSDDQDSKNQDQQQDQQAEQNESEKPDDDESQQQQAAQDKQNDLSEQAAEQWLRRIPDDPGGLLRNKFKYLYQRQNNTTNEDQPW